MKLSKADILGSLKDCVNSRTLCHGRLVHQNVIKSGFGSDLLVGNVLIDMYAKCGSLEDSRRVFDRLPSRDTVSWGAIISAYSRYDQHLAAGRLFDKMQKEGIHPSSYTYSCILKVCSGLGSITDGRVLHHKILEAGFDSNLIVANSVIDLYLKCQSIDDACNAFHQSLNRDVVTWGTMITGCVDHGQDQSALVLFKQMQQEGVASNMVILSCVLKACTRIKDVERGTLIHLQVIESQLQSDVVIGSALIDMYAKCGRLEKACTVFAHLSRRDVMSWCAMISGYTMNGHGLYALKLFTQMQHESIKPNDVCFSCALKACGSVGALQEGRELHNQIIRGRFEADAVIGNTLIDMYMKCACLQDAQTAFDSLCSRDMQSYGAIVAGYSQHGESLSVIAIFKFMTQQGLLPNKYIHSCIVKSCGNLGASGLGMLTHHQIVENGLELDILLGNTLVDMYGSFGNLNEAHKVFIALPNHDIISWGAIIMAYATHGDCQSAGELFEDMLRQGISPDEMLFTSLFTACSNMASVDKGCQYFHSMTEEHGLMPSIEHYSCMVDLLGRAGFLREAVDLLKTIPALPDIIMHTSLLTSCRLCGNLELGRECFDQVVHHDPAHASAYLLMSNIYCDMNMSECSDEIQELRYFSSASKKPGKAWIEVNNRVQEFIVGGESQVQCMTSCIKWKIFRRYMKMEGYTPHLDSVFQGQDEQGG